MAIGNSGRIVIEIDPGLKKTFYQELRKDGITLKEWFLQKASDYIDLKNQPLLFEDTTRSKSKNQKWV